MKPITLPGWLVSYAISVMLSADVFEASIGVGREDLTEFLETSFLTILS